MTADLVVAELPKNGRDRLRITIGEYRGHRVVGLRIWAPGDAGPIPTKQGFAIAPEKLDALIDALQQARALAVARRWLPVDQRQRMAGAS